VVFTGSRVEKAQDGYREKDSKKIEDAHDKELIRKDPFQDISSGGYIKDVVFGASDGIVTTFAIVAGATGARFSFTIILILGVANLLADGFSMAAANYLATKSGIDYAKKEREREQWEIENMPNAEKEEVKQIFRKKGLSPRFSMILSKIVASNKKVWLDLMLHEELGIVLSKETSPKKNAAATFFSFLAAGFVPLLFFVLALTFGLPNPFALSAVVTALTLFTVGALRIKVTGKNWVKSGVEMLSIGGVAATIAFAVGYLLQSLIG
jgi:vacuolar iron transporter family protein